MSDIQGLLEELSVVSGVRGAAVATPDGIVAASSLRGRYKDDVVVGLASFLISTTSRAMGDDAAPPKRMTMHCTHGKLLVVDIGEAYLIVITDQFVRMEHLEVELDDIARRMRHAARIDV